MEHKTLLKQWIDTPAAKRRLAEEEFTLECTELIYRLMEQQNVSRPDLAKKRGMTKGRVTELLDGRRNMTLRMMAVMLFVLRAEFTPLRRIGG